MNITLQYAQYPKRKLIFLGYQQVSSACNSLRINEKRENADVRIEALDKIKIPISNVNFDMIYCPKGVFEMTGYATREGYNGMNPPKSTEIESPFFLSETEVTQELYQAVTKKNPCENKHKHPKKPVENVSWFDAVIFCIKLSIMKGLVPYYHISDIQFETDDAKKDKNIKSARVSFDLNANGFRLPDWREWEYAAKAGTNNTYSGTDSLDNLGEYASIASGSYDFDGTNALVKSKKPNEWGFYDMTGNLNEWVDDKNRYMMESLVVRGGAYFYESHDALRIDYLSRYAKYAVSNFIGFRIAASSNHDIGKKTLEMCGQLVKKNKKGIGNK